MVAVAIVAFELQIFKRCQLKFRFTIEETFSVGMI